MKKMLSLAFIALALSGCMATNLISGKM
ncbi:lipoprotein [Utexia brackfieldae]